MPSLPYTIMLTQIVSSENFKSVFLWWKISASMMVLICSNIRLKQPSAVQGWNGLIKSSGIYMYFNRFGYGSRQVNLLFTSHKDEPQIACACGQELMQFVTPVNCVALKEGQQNYLLGCLSIRTIKKSMTAHPITRLKYMKQ